MAEADPVLKSPSLAAQVRTAVIWRSGSQVLTQIVSWASTLIVIRLLAPQDYGLFAMAQVMLTLLSTMNGWGLASALIREEEVTEERLRQTLGMLILLNGGLALTQFLAAPLVAHGVDLLAVVHGLFGAESSAEVTRRARAHRDHSPPRQQRQEKNIDHKHQGQTRKNQAHPDSGRPCRQSSHVR